MTAPTYNTNELASVRPQLRADVSFSLQQYGGQACYVVEDHAAGKFYRIGLPEYAFVSLLDGRTTIGEAMAATAEKLGGDAFGEQEAAAICRWLVECQLIATDHAAGVDRLLDAADQSKRRARLQWLNPLMLKLPLGNPEPLLRMLAPPLLWLVSKPVMVLALLLWLVGGHQLYVGWEALRLDLGQMLVPSNWLWLGVGFVGLKVIHELAHALACRRFGGEVREAGLVFILLAPIPYVDVTSSWRFRSKWQRIAVAAAGMFAELTIAAVAAVVWSTTDDPLLRHHAANLIVLASVTTLLFNANFLMRFDGYYIFADLVEIPNLYSLGQQYLLWLGRRWLMGVDALPPRWPLKKAAVVRAYGVASFVWRIVICAALTLAAAGMFHGAGVVLAVLALVLWIGVPLVRFGRYLVLGGNREQPRRLRFALICIGVGTTLFLALNYLPSPGTVSAPGVVQYKNLTTLRSASPGFVRSVHVAHGSRVSKGDILIRLENPTLRHQLEYLEIALQQSDTKARQYFQEGQIAAWQSESRNGDSLRDRIKQRQAQVDALTIRAPMTGFVVSKQVDELAGQFLHTGEDILVLADDETEILLSIDQRDAAAFGAALGSQVEVRHRSREANQTAVLASIQPTATDALTHPALASTACGPLTVRPSGADGGNTWRLIQPRLNARLDDQTRPNKRRVGTVVYVYTNQLDETLGEFIVSRWDTTWAWRFATEARAK